MITVITSKELDCSRNKPYVKCSPFDMLFEALDYESPFPLCTLYKKTPFSSCCLITPASLQATHNDVVITASDAALSLNSFEFEEITFALTTYFSQEGLVVEPFADEGWLLWHDKPFMISHNNNVSIKNHLPIGAHQRYWHHSFASIQMLLSTLSFNQRRVDNRAPIVNGVLFTPCEFKRKSNKKVTLYTDKKVLLEHLSAVYEIKGIYYQSPIQLCLNKYDEVIIFVHTLTEDDIKAIKSQNRAHDICWVSAKQYVLCKRKRFIWF